VLYQQCPQQGQEDTVLWRGKNDYSVKDFQRHMSMEIEIDSVVSTVWMKLAPPKVEFFMWLALLGRLNTRQRFHDRGILQAEQSTCTFCALQPESIDHVLLSCTYSQQIWRSFASEMGQSLIFPASFKQHYESWMGLSWKNGLRKKLWASTFFAVAWTIWLTRNEILFQNQIFNHMAICQSIKRKIAFWTKAWDVGLPCTEDEFARNFANISEVLQ